MKNYSKITKTLLLVLIITIVLCITSFASFALQEENYDFDNFTEEDSMEFVYTHNIDIPTRLLSSENLDSITLSLVLQSYNNPNTAFCFNYDKTQQYAEEIRMAVRSYMNLDAIPAAASITTYSLQYNSVMDDYGNWVTNGGYYDYSWLNYNCYAYSINRVEQPQFYSSDPYIQYQPGDMSSQGSFDNCENINQLANIVVADLQAMGYSNVSTSATIPTINYSQELICVRMNDADYHFMHYDLTTDAWYHKPGNTAILKYNIVPTNNNLWYREVSFEGIEYEFAYEPAYDSDIIFIRYSKKEIDVNGDVEFTEYITPEKDVLCEIFLFGGGTYKFTFDSTESFEYHIYNKDFGSIISGDGASDSFSIRLNAGKHYLRMNFESCDYLNYIDVSIHKHEFTDHYDIISDNQHKAYCECGHAESTESHHESYCGKYNSSLHYVYCECGYLVGTGYHDMEPGWKLGTSHCTMCGYIRDNTGFGEAIMGIEDENSTQ